MLSILKPENIIPTHAEPEKLQGLKDLAIEMNYAPEKVHILGNGQLLKL